MDINGLLAALCVADNATRRAAEESYEATKSSNPATLASVLIGAVRTPSLPPHLRVLGAVLLRRLISGNRSEWENIDEESQRSICLALLECVSGDGDDAIRRKMSDALAELACDLLYDDPEGGWPGLLQALMTMVNHPDGCHREVSLDVLARISECVVPQLEAQMPIIVEIFRARLSDSIPVRSAALKCLSSFLACVGDSGIEVYQPLLPGILTAISDPAAAEAAHEMATKDMIEILVEVVEMHPRFFRPAINEFSSFFVALAGSGAPQPLRTIALEWCVSLAEAKPTLARKVSVGAAAEPFARATLQVCCGMMLQLEEDPDFDKEEEDTGDDVDIRPEDVGAQALDRIALALGPKTALPVAFTLIDESLKREAAGGGWVFAHCAMHTVCQIVESGKGTEFAGPLQAQVVACACQLLGHPHPRVRYMAIQAIGQTLLDHGPEVQRVHIQTLFPVLRASMAVATNPSPRIRAHAASALINLVDFCDRTMLGPFLNEALVAAVQAMQSGPRIVQEQAVALVSSAAMVMEAHLGEDNYALLMPMLQAALASCPAEDDYRVLKGRLLECITLIGTAAPRERFAADVMPVMASMVEASRGGLSDDPQKAYILKAWVRIAKALGASFVPYLEHVIPPLLADLEAAVGEELTDEQIDDDDAEADSDTECIIQNADGKFVAVRTSALEEQASAAHMVGLLAESMGAHFFPYVERTSKGLAELISSSVHDDVRCV